MAARKLVWPVALGTALLLLTLFLPSHVPPAAQETETTASQDSEAVARHAKRVQRHGRELRLLLSNGDDARLYNIGSCEGDHTCQVFEFQDYWEDVNFFAVELRRGESSEWLLIDSSAGQRQTFSGEPVRSPDRRAIVVLPDPIASVQSSLEVWALDDKGSPHRLVKKFEASIPEGYELEQWSESGGFRLTPSKIHKDTKGDTESSPLCVAFDSVNWLRFALKPC